MLCVVDQHDPHPNERTLEHIPRTANNRHCRAEDWRAGRGSGPMPPDAPLDQNGSACRIFATRRSAVSGPRAGRWAEAAASIHGRPGRLIAQSLFAAATYFAQLPRHSPKHFTPGWNRFTC